MKISILTPTGDRPASLLRQKRYIQRSVYPKSWKIEWIVVDDGQKPFDPGDCSYHRREPDGPNSLERNMYSIGQLDSEYVMIWEDDEWYGPNRIKDQIKAIDKSTKHMHGYREGIYYHLPSRGYRQMRNNDHASWCETVMTTELWNKLIEFILKPKGDTVYLDIKMWRMFGPEHGFLTDNVPNRCTLGLKGLG